MQLTYVYRITETPQLLQWTLLTYNCYSWTVNNASQGATDGSPTVTLCAIEITMEQYYNVQDRRHIYKATYYRLNVFYYIVIFLKQADPLCLCLRITHYRVKLINYHLTCNYVINMITTV